MKKNLLLLFILLAITVKSQDKLDFIKNNSLKKEITFMLKYLDYSPKTKVLKDSIVFIDISYIDSFNLLTIGFQTRLDKCDYIKNDRIHTHRDCIFESFYYKNISDNRIILFRDAKQFLKRGIKRDKISNLNKRVMRFEFFEDPEPDDIKYLDLNNCIQYRINDLKKLEIERIETYDLTTFFLLRKGVDVEQRKMKYE